VVNFRTVTSQPKMLGKDVKNLIYYKSSHQSPDWKEPATPDRIKSFIKSKDI
jgi:hypothetical protein